MSSHEIDFSSSSVAPVGAPSHTKQPLNLSVCHVSPDGSSRSPTTDFDHAPIRPAARSDKSAAISDSLQPSCRGTWQLFGVLDRMHARHDSVSQQYGPICTSNKHFSPKGPKLANCSQTASKTTEQEREALRDAVLWVCCICSTWWGLRRIARQLAATVFSLTHDAVQHCHARLMQLICSPCAIAVSHAVVHIRPGPILSLDRFIRQKNHLKASRSSTKSRMMLSPTTDADHCVHTYTWHTPRIWLQVQRM